VRTAATAELRPALDRHWDNLVPASRAAAADLWAHPELGLMEHYGSSLLSGWLEREGFRVTRGPAGLRDTGRI
jgi:aminobenzoyl-glutamate utilization protein B